MKMVKERFTPKRMRISPIVTTFALATTVLSTPVILSDSALYAQGTFDRKIPPAVGEAKPLVFPKIQERKLANGIPVAVMEDHSSPVVSVVAVLDVSTYLDPKGKDGLASLVSSMLSEGTSRHTANQLSDEYANLGNTVSPFGFYTIPANFDRSLQLMAEQLLTPSFPDEALQRLKAQRISGIKRSMENPGYLGSRVFASKLYGADHAYSRVESEASISSISKDDIRNFYRSYYRPPNIKFVVAGAISPEDAVAKLDMVFGRWDSGENGRVIPPEPHDPDSTVIYLYDRPNSPQSVIMIGALAPRRDNPDYYAIDFMNTTLGGAFNSRLNLNLREKHQYSYGAGSRFTYRNVPELGVFSASSSVVAAKTDSALIEFMKEIRGIHGESPITKEEFEFAKSQSVSVLPLQFETVKQRADAVASLYRRALPLDFYNQLVDNYKKVDYNQVLRVAKERLNPGKLVIVVVGDKSQIEAGLRATGIAPVVVVDSL